MTVTQIKPGTPPPEPSAPAEAEQYVRVQQRVICSDRKQEDGDSREGKGTAAHIDKFITPARPVSPVLSSSEIGRELRALASTLENDSADPESLQAAQAIREELTKMSVLEHQLNALLKG